MVEVINTTITDQFIDSVTYSSGESYLGNLANTQTDDSSYYSSVSGGTTTLNLFFDPHVVGRDFYLDIDAYCEDGMGAETHYLKINGVNEIVGSTIHVHDYLIEDVNSIVLYSGDGTGATISYIYYFKIIAVPVKMDFQVDMQVTDPEAEFVDSLKYSHKTNVSQTVDLDIWNWDTEQWYEIESVNNNATFDDDSFALGQDSDYVNSTNGVRIRYQAEGSYPYQLEIDRLALNYSILPSNPYADVTKTISDSFLDRYDSGFSNYQKLYEITIDFDYRFTKIDSAFDDFAKFYIDGSDFALSKDGSWHNYSDYFEYDSASRSGFDVMFNVSNGLLEIDNMEYNFRFKSLDTSDHILLQQDFLVEFTEEDELATLKNVQNSNFLIYNSYTFATNADAFTYYNTYGRTYKLEIIYKVKADDQWYTSIYSTSLADSGVKIFNVSQFMLDNLLVQFQDFEVEYVLTGNNSDLTVYYLTLNCSTAAKNIQEYYRITDNVMGQVSDWIFFNSSAYTTLNDFGELPANFSIEYKVIDFAGNEGTSIIYNANYKNVIYSLEKTISLSDSEIDLNSIDNREISFQNTGQFNDVNLLDVYINGFRYGTASLISNNYVLSFGAENSKNTLLAYSDSLMTDYVYSNINPLNHVSWEVREDDYFGVVKHVLVEEDIVIANQLSYNTTAQLDLEHLYDRGFGLFSYQNIGRVYYYNSSNSNSIVLLTNTYDFTIDKSGMVEFTEFSKGNGLYEDNLPFDIENFKDQFKEIFYDLKFLAEEVTDKITTSGDKDEDERRLAEWKELIEATYRIVCEPAFSGTTSSDFFKIVMERIRFTVLDTVMRSKILVDKSSSSGGPSVYEVATKIRSFLNNKQKVGDVNADVLSANGRMAFFTFFSEAFFDDSQGKKLKISTELRRVVGRDQEASDYFGDLIQRYVDTFVSSGFSFVGFIDAFNYGLGDVLGGNEFLGGQMSEIENSMLGIDISEISKWAPSDRRFFDNLVAIFLNAYLANPTKGTMDPKGISGSQRGEASNDWISGQFMTVLLEMSKVDAKIRDILPYLITVAAPSNNPTSTLKSLMNYVAKKGSFDMFRNGKEGAKLKMPSKYTFLFEFANYLNAEIDLTSVVDGDLNTAVQRVQDYINNNEEEITREMKKLAKGIYTSHETIKPQFYQAIVQFFTSETKLESLLRSRIDGGYDLAFKDFVNMLFKQDVDGTTRQLTPAILPSDIEIWDGDKWIALPYEYKFDSAHVMVHYRGSSGEIKNGILKVDTISTTLPDGVYEGYYDRTRKTNNVYHNIYLCDSNGKQLFSEVKLRLETGKKTKFEVRRKVDKHEWYEQFVDQVSKNPIKSFYISFGISSGNQFTFFLQDTVLSMSANSKSYERYLVDLKFKERSKVTSEGPLLGLNIQEDLYFRINSILGFLYQLEQFSQTGEDIFISERMVQLEGKLAPSGEQFSFDYYQKVLTELSPSNIDLKNLDISDTKIYYETLLKILKNAIGNEFFKDYKSLKLIEGKEFSSGVELVVDSQNDDLMLIVKVNQVLKEIMGFSGSILFKLGFLNFEKLATNSYVVKAMGQTYDNFLKFMRRANIESIFTPTSYSTIQELISSIMFVGYKETIKIKKDGSPEFRVINYEQRTSILSDLYDKDIVLTSLDNKYIMINNFLDTFYAEYKREADLSQIGRALSIVLDSQFSDQTTDQLIRLGMDPRHVNSFRTMAYNCLNKYLFSAADYGGDPQQDYAVRFREKLSEFISTEGISVKLNLQALRVPLADYLRAYPIPGLTLEMLFDIFATINLDKSDYDNLFKQFEGYKVTKHILATGDKGWRHQPDYIFRTRIDHIISLANFFAYMAKTYGGTNQKVRIYGYSLKREGLGYKTSNVNAYFPKINAQIQDPNMPKNNLQYFELDFNNLDQFDFILFLGSFLADEQTFVVKTNGMEGNEFLFAFNAVSGAIDIGDIYPSLRSDEVKPCSMDDFNAGLKWSDDIAHNDLETLFNSIMNAFKQDNFVTVHRYNEIEVWREYCEKVSALKDFSTLVNTQ